MLIGQDWLIHAENQSTCIHFCRYRSKCRNQPLSALIQELFSIAGPRTSFNYFTENIQLKLFLLRYDGIRAGSISKVLMRRKLHFLNCRL